MKRALVTGSDGFVGRHMEAWFLQHGWETNICDITYDFPVQEFVRQPHRASGSGVFQFRYDVVVHAAAQGPNRKAIDTTPSAFVYNTMLDALMFEWAIRTKQRRFVYLSSSAIYPANLQWATAHEDGRITDGILLKETLAEGAPFDHYGLAKLHGEHMAAYARQAGLPVTVVRPFTGYGSDQTIDFPFRAFVERARHRVDPFPVWGSAQQVRDFIHIDDICEAIMVLVDAEVTLPVNLCTGIGTTFEELKQLVCAEAGYNPAIQVLNDEPMGVQYRVGDPTFLNHFYVPKVTLGDGVHRAFLGV